MINLVVKPIKGTTHKVKIRMGVWSWKVDISNIPMDDYQVIWGMEFFDQAKLFLMSFANGLCIVKRDKNYIVLVI